MKINKDTMKQELTNFLDMVFHLPEVSRVQIKDIEIRNNNEDDIKKCIEECYHDILSDIDVCIYVSLHPEDAGNGHGYQSNPERIGLTREHYLGLVFISNSSNQLYRVIMRNGIRFDLIFYVTEDSSAPIYQIQQEMKEERKDDGKYWPRWDLRKTDEFWFTEIHALAKLMRGDYLIADHLANMQLNETLVAQMVERDDLYGTNYHRYGYKEELNYTLNTRSEFTFEVKDETYNFIANKIISAAVSYDRLIKRLNPLYEERRSIFFDIWKSYESGLNNTCMSVKNYTI